MLQGDLFAQDMNFYIQVDGRELPVEERRVAGDTLFLVRGIGALPFCVKPAKYKSGQLSWMAVGNRNQVLAAQLGREIAATRLRRA